MIFKNNYGAEVYMIKVYIQFSSILTTIISSFFLLMGIIGLSPKDIAGLLSIYQNKHLELIDVFSQKIIYAKIGFAFLLLSFLLQMLQTYFPVSSFWQLKNLRGIIYALSSVIIVSICAYFFADIIAINLSKEFIGVLLN